MEESELPKKAKKTFTLFRPKPYLFRLLGAVFLAEFIVIGYSLFKCASVNPTKESLTLQARCPEIGRRSQEMFTLATATILSLLTDTGKME